ncbi:MAG: hypothetical protein ACOCUI_05590, partial [bacterium]
MMTINTTNTTKAMPANKKNTSIILSNVRFNKLFYSITTLVILLFLNNVSLLSQRHNVTGPSMGVCPGETGSMTLESSTSGEKYNVIWNDSETFDDNLEPSRTWTGDGGSHTWTGLPAG